MTRIRTAAVCKTCYKARAASYRRVKKEAKKRADPLAAASAPVVVDARTKPCIECGEQKPLTDFYPHRPMADGRLNVCKPCHKVRYSRSYRRPLRKRS
jgi:hypothetical protein